MATVGVRALKQNASAVVAEAAAGEIITITDRGRPVAMLTPLRKGRLATLLASGGARPRKCSIADLASPEPALVATSTVLAAMRDDERF